MICVIGGSEIVHFAALSDGAGLAGEAEASGTAEGELLGMGEGEAALPLLLAVGALGVVCAVASGKTWIVGMGVAVGLLSSALPQPQSRSDSSKVIIIAAFFILILRYN